MRTLLLLAIPLLAVSPVLAQGHGMGPGHGRGMGQGMGPDEAHGTIHALLADHEAIERRVVDRPDGVETWTESDDPEVAARIRTHVRQMKERLEDGRPIRRWDPLFAEIFEHADAIEMTIEDLPRGVRVIETSEDPYVVALIQQHAHRAVSEFVAGGMDRAHEPTPLPEAAAAHSSAPDRPAGSAVPAFDDARATSSVFHEGEGYRLVGFAFRAGQGLPEHAAPLDAFFRVTEGSVRVTLGEAVHELEAGEGVLLPKDVPHTIEATADARAVLIR